MKEIDQARRKIDQIEESAAEQYKNVVKEFLSSLNTSAFPTGPSNRGRMQAIELGFAEDNRVIATPQGLFMVDIVGKETFYESSSRYVEESMVEVSNGLYRQFAPKLLAEIEGREQLRNHLQESLHAELQQLEQSSLSAS